jgi:RNA polymerase sigma factor (sigma-70 family)
MASRVADLELLEQWRAGHSAAGDQLVQRHFIGVRGYFIAKFAQDHEDLTQETFSRLVAGRDRFRGGSTFKAYLYSIARNVSHEYLRKRYKLAVPLETASLAELTGRRLSSILAEREEHRMLLDALRRLPLEQQELLELHYWQRLSGTELGEIYERPESTIRGRLRTALKQLGRTYHELGQQPHARELSSGEIEAWMQTLREQLGRASLRPE